MNTDVSESTDETEIGDLTEREVQSSLLNSSIEPRESDPQSRV